MNTTHTETRGFQSEVKQLLNLMIHSLYSNKEIFLRELISNAADAADKLRFKALENPDIYGTDANLNIRIWIDKDAGTLTLSDNGIGMSREEVIDNLGTIAKSGTKSFLDNLGTEQLKDSRLIGQFGVGFYSAFIVADKVTVITRSAYAQPDEGVEWQSSGEAEYHLKQVTKENRGTDIILHLRDDNKEFLEEWRLRTIISKYSDHISLPVEIQTKDEKEDSLKWEKINKAEALWTRNKRDISAEEYQEFYKYISHDYADPLSWTHNKVEGKQEYTSLLFLPAKAPWDLWNRDYTHGLKLYVQRVFILDDAKQFLPNYLRFVKGLIDCNDLPLNISREMLQDSKLIATMRSALTKRTLSLLEKVAAEDNEKYQQFWNEFGQVLKEGSGEDIANRETLTKLFRFATTHSNTSNQTVSLQEYVARMPASQNNIYFITADSYQAANSSPHLELFRQQGLEVLLLSDRIDEWMMSHLTEFADKPFLSINKADESLEKLASITATESQKESEARLEPFIYRVKTVLGKTVKEVKWTHRLTDTPAVVTTANDEMSTQMAKLFAAAGQKAPEIHYTFAINPDHRLIQQMANVEEETEFANWVHFLFEQALLAEQGTLQDPNRFIQRVNHLLTQS